MNTEVSESTYSKAFLDIELQHPVVSKWNSSNGYSLAQYEWACSECDAPTLLILPGWGDGLQRWCHVGTFFSSKGLKVIGFDYFAHGRSQGTSSEIDFTEMRTDVKSFIEKEKPVYIYAHSTGCPLGLIALTQTTHKPKAVVYSSPALGIGFMPETIITSFGYCCGCVTLHVPTISASDLMHNLKAQEATKKDKLYWGWSCSISNLSKLVDLYKEAREIKMIQNYPFLVIHSKRDKIIPFHYGKALWNANQNEQNEFLETECGHEAHNEVDWKTTMENILKFLKV